MKKSVLKSIKSFNVNEGVWAMFQINCKVLGRTQSDVLDHLLRSWNAEQKLNVNEIILKGRDAE